MINCQWSSLSARHFTWLLTKGLKLGWNHQKLQTEHSQTPMQCLYLGEFRTWISCISNAYRDGVKNIFCEQPDLAPESDRVWWVPSPWGSHNSCSNSVDKIFTIKCPTFICMIFRCIIVAIIGSVGNLMTLLAIPWAIHKKKLGFHKTPWKFTHIFIVNLALADFLYCTTSLPLYSLTVYM